MFVLEPLQERRLLSADLPSDAPADDAAVSILVIDDQNSSDQGSDDMEDASDTGDELAAGDADPIAEDSSDDSSENSSDDPTLADDSADQSDADASSDASSDQDLADTGDSTDDGMVHTTGIDWNIGVAYGGIAHGGWVILDFAGGEAASDQMAGETPLAEGSQDLQDYDPVIAYSGLPQATGDQPVTVASVQASAPPAQAAGFARSAFSDRVISSVFNDNQQLLANSEPAVL